MTENATVAVLGTGIMGAAMARNLLEAGMKVRVWNRTREKVRPLEEAGATAAGSPAEAAEGAHFLITMLPDADTVEEVIGGEVLPVLAEGGVWLQMSTVGIEGNEQLEALAAESGIAYVDAPVIGTRQPAEQGRLIVLASGPEEVRERCQPVFEAVGSKTVWLGETGSGSRLKLVVNNWIAGLVGVLGETIALARAVGVDAARFLEVIEGGPLGLPYAQIKGKMMVEEEFPTNFSLELARKDVRLILDAAEARGLHLAVAEAVATRFDDAMRAGHGEEDIAAIYHAIGADSV